MTGAHMKIFHVIHGIANASAGPTYAVGRLGEELNHLGDSASVITLGERPLDWSYDTDYWIDGSEIALRTGISFAMMAKVRHLSNGGVILHGHSVWRMTNLFPLLINSGTPSRIVISPRGTLSQWAMNYKKFIKLPFWNLRQRPALSRCHAFLATAENELQDIERAGIRGEGMLIPNGVDIPDVDMMRPRPKHILFLSRIHPVKGLDMLIKAWKSLAEEFPDWSLDIAGALDGEYATSVQKLVRTESVPRVNFLGEVHGDEKSRLFREASLFVLPSFTENFGIVVAEALAAGVPVITTTGTPWKGLLEAHGCGWTVNPEQHALSVPIRHALSRTEGELRAIGGAGRSWMERDYSWSGVAEQMHIAYDYLLHGGSRPGFVHSI